MGHDGATGRTPASRHVRRPRSLPRLWSAGSSPPGSTRRSGCPTRRERLCFGIPGGLCEDCPQLYIDPDLIELLDLGDRPMRLRDRERPRAPGAGLVDRRLTRLSFCARPTAGAARRPDRCSQTHSANASGRCGASASLPGAPLTLQSSSTQPVERGVQLAGRPGPCLLGQRLGPERLEMPIAPRRPGALPPSSSRSRMSISSRNRRWSDGQRGRAPAVTSSSARAARAACAPCARRRRRGRPTSSPAPPRRRASRTSSTVTARHDGGGARASPARPRRCGLGAAGRRRPRGRARRRGPRARWAAPGRAEARARSPARRSRPPSAVGRGATAATSVPPAASRPRPAASAPCPWQPPARLEEGEAVAGRPQPDRLRRSRRVPSLREGARRAGVTTASVPPPKRERRRERARAAAATPAGGRREASRAGPSEPRLAPVAAGQRRRRSARRARVASPSSSSPQT